MNVTLLFSVAARRFSRAAGDDRQIEPIDEQLGLKLLIEARARIDNYLSGNRIESVFLELANPHVDGRQFLQRNSCQFPCHCWSIDLEKCEPQFRTRAQKNLRAWKQNRGLLRMKRRAPARLFGQSVTTLAFDLGRNRDPMALGQIEYAFYRNAVAAREQLYIFHRRLD